MSVRINDSYSFRFFKFYGWCSELFKYVVKYWGTPQNIVSDQDSRFTGVNFHVSKDNVFLNGKKTTFRGKYNNEDHK